ncbi:DeoR/GlpR family DNA-binding transcription regulator [Caldicellulosiruptor naganoensis]|uniref:DeoR/GlpR family DNA-binding transcription regulator n=1 Tax=Caldicellulosiruptor naganoensis TaxID=29324 RepID=A0ABY7BEV8_9FIRM|nr:DeoR/GlpR family DNA-binding transcription regulator [Caldicellulosiruptor naganoensis]WAM31347.1 DeoR/GlpR family DNA-binding transcription regulator [Caldicellulosiruptor naganoensis]
MLSATRRQKIKEILMEKKSVTVTELCNIFNVSDETIRRDLKKLEQEGIIEKNYGGAILKEGFTIVPPISQRAKEFIEEKEKIAKEAVKRIKEGMIVILDTGTTTQQIARNLKTAQNITVITNSVNIINELVTNSNINLFLVGGKVKSSNFSIVGPEAQKSFMQFSADIAFIGTSGISLEKGLTTSDIFEAEVKKAMIESSREVIVVADSSKFLKNAMVSFCSLNKITEIITSGEIDKDLIEKFRQKGVKLTIV